MLAPEAKPCSASELLWMKGDGGLRRAQERETNLFPQQIASDPL